MTFPVRALQDFVIVQKYEPKHKEGQLILPSTITDSNIVRIVALGPSCDTSLKVNDLVLIEKYAGTAFSYSNSQYICLKFNQVIGQYLENEKDDDPPPR